ncbi:TetR/AcrR family transcriptional regulator, partial [Rhizobium ruizarguesonis]
MGIGSPSLYAAFGSKEALYAEALRHYRDNNESLVWAGFFSAGTAREALALADKGADVAINYERSADRAAEVVRAIEGKGR